MITVQVEYLNTITFPEYPGKLIFTKRHYFAELNLVKIASSNVSVIFQCFTITFEVTILTRRIKISEI